MGEWGANAVTTCVWRPPMKRLCVGPILRGSNRSECCASSDTVAYLAVVTCYELRVRTS